jgi:alkanesulfonate monooxygenase SsuD/methylene tetrahydromethanopterin reductase-like flavin-dependent oxidoreductase (luciferase family)
MGPDVADILSDGRLEFGVGRGIARHYASYGIPPEESRGRFDEALDFILAAWTNDSFSFEGKYFQARDLTVVPRPVRRCRRPTRRCGSPPTAPTLSRSRRDTGCRSSRRR